MPTVNKHSSLVSKFSDVNKLTLVLEAFLPLCKNFINSLLMLYHNNFDNAF